MNRFLASILTTLNALYAIGIMIFFVCYGAIYQQPSGVISIFGAAVGGVIGIVVASMFCGLIAFLTLIEGHLRYLTETAEYQVQREYERANQGQ